ncbi:O-antigen polymerase [Mycolicibacterium sp. CBMA 226]|uniref:O-antigen polymerase n=1 Tax=Mycolicibacterium sp. CBMA 226 TaxID=2606611 RepID=UPI001413245F|nr:O-antigen polymerase [Mycolicibacterium sp. CBMA 226]
MTTGEKPAAKPAAREPESRLWWHSPAVVVTFVGTIGVLLSAVVSDETFRVLWNEPKLVTTQTLLIFEIGTLTFGFGAAVAAAAIPKQDNLSRKWPNLDDTTRTVLHWASVGLFPVILLGYGTLFFLLFRSGFSVTEILGAGENQWDTPVKNAIGSVPVVSTLVVFTAPAVVISMLLLVDRYSRAELGRLVVLVVMSLAQAQVNSERSAFLGAVVPIVLVGTAAMARSGRWRRRIAKAVPAFLLVGVVFIFSLGEYFRTWSFYKEHGTGTFPEFVLYRLAGYYATALNNGQIILDHLNWPNRIPYDTIEFFWSMQGIYQLRLYEFLGGRARPNAKAGSGAPGSLYQDALHHFANPEFNNTSGYVAPYVDYGIVGGTLFLLFAGGFAGVLYRGFCRGWPFALLLFPIGWTGYAEFPRVYYWSNPGVTYMWIASLAVIVAIQISRRLAARRRASIFRSEPGDIAAENQRELVAVTVDSGKHHRKDQAAEPGV